LFVMSGWASIGILVALHTPQMISNKVIKPIMNLFFMENFIILFNTSIVINDE